MHLRHVLKRTQQSILQFWHFVVLSAHLCGFCLVNSSFLVSWVKKAQLDCVPGVPKESSLGMGHHLCEMEIEYPVPQTPFRNPWLSVLYESYP